MDNFLIILKYPLIVPSLYSIQDFIVTVWTVSHFFYQRHSSSFFADIKNPLNQYFVKYAWGWTLYPLGFLLAVSSLQVEVVNQVTFFQV